MLDIGEMVHLRWKSFSFCLPSQRGSILKERINSLKDTFFRIEFISEALRFKVKQKKVTIVVSLFKR